MTMTINNYDDAQAHAYRLLNKVSDMAGDERTKLSAVRWEWTYDNARYMYHFHARYGMHSITIDKKDTDMFDNEWYDAAAQEITAWLLLLKDVPKQASTKF